MAKRKVIRKSNRPFTYNPHYYSWGGDFIKSLNLKDTFNFKDIFSGSNVGNMLTKGISGAAGSAVGNIAGSAISGGLKSGAGSAISNIGGTIGGAVSAVNPVLGGIISAGTSIIGGLTNRMFGSKLNKGKIAEVEGINKAINTVMVDNSSADSIEDQWANQDFGADFFKSDIGKDGWFSNKAKNKYKELKRQQDIARNRALASYENAAEAADTQSDLNAMASFAAFGGPLGIWGGYGSGAIGYELAKENLGIKALNAANKGRLTSLPNSFESPKLNTFAKGGKIHIKPENRGKFTEYCGGKVTSECIAKGKRSSDPAVRKRATFAANARKWHHAFGGDLLTHGADFANGQIIVGNGGTHEENPMEGVPMGMDAEGNPNLVEQGEVIFNDYVFSNRLFADGGLLESFNLPKSYDGYSFAAIAEKLGDESKERPNDPISKRGLLSSMSRLQQAQEMIRQSKNTGNKKSFGGGLKSLATSLFGSAFDNYRLAKGNLEFGMFGAPNPYAHGGKMGTLFDGLGNESNNLKRANFFLEPTEDNYSYNPFIDMAYTDPDKNTYDIYKYGVGITPNGEFVETPKYMARAAAKRAGYDVGSSLDDYNKNPIKVPEKKKSAVSRLLSNLDATDLRYAPVVGAAIGLGQNLFSRPDYTSADAILEAANQAGNYTPIGYTPIGNYLQYRPFDRNFYLNKLNAQAGATRRAIMNTTSPSRNAALLAADYNAQGRLGDLARQAEEYNLAQRQAVEQFNRGTNQANAEMGLKAAMANQEAALKARSSRLSGVAQAMAVRDAVDARRGASMSANLTNLFDSLGNIGIDAYNREDRDKLIRAGVFGTLSEKPQEWSDETWKEYKDYINKSLENKTPKVKGKQHSKGGYLTIKKGKQHGKF
jgi:hypothetical protein